MKAEYSSMGTTKESRYCYDTCTVADIIHDTMPCWETIEDWFMWPPDVFLMTSLILKRTGCYRYVLNDAEWNYNEEQEGIPGHARSWLKQINKKLLNDQASSDQNEAVPPIEFELYVKNLINELSELSEKVTIQQLKVLEGCEAERLCQVLVLAHSLADEACAGFGILSDISKDSAIAVYLANLLLVARGTLSAVPKFHGVVIPKMRTPQSGFSSRSLSIHLTFHSTEVEVMWRTIPWTNIEENTINILAIPWPAIVKENCFCASKETFQHVRHFTYDQKNVITSQLDGVVELIKRIDSDISRVHILTFPELALNQDEYRELLYKLMMARSDGVIKHIPMIITGVRKERANEVRLAAYFAGKWYDLKQSKHHRWKLNRSQIRQYSLEGRLATARNWYEDIVVEQRRLTFLVPNGWLALCPLICEDLAQLEPVSEIIRGVGPTMLIALLMDGPQLKERWPARYASVFADDPGTAVLTLTSLGMAARSMLLQEDNLTLKKDSFHDELDAADQKNNRKVALWKDQIKGWYPVELSKNNDAILLTISADWTEEFTADGRSDNGYAAVFKLEGGRQFSLNGHEHNQEKDDNVKKASAVENRKQDWEGDWLDIRQLSEVTFALDAIIELKGEHFDIIKSFLLKSNEGGATSANRPEKRSFADLVVLLGIAHSDPGGTGISTIKRRWPTDSLNLAVEEMNSLREALKHDNPDNIDYYNKLFTEAFERLRKNSATQNSSPPTVSATTVLDDMTQSMEKERKRINKAIPLAILFSIHGRLDKLRKKAYKKRGDSIRGAELLLSKIEEALSQFDY